MSKQNTKQQSNPQPLFYNKPVPLMPDKHSEAGVSSKISYLFTRETNSIPITMPEFIEVSKTYPIVFSDNESADPVAVIGIESNKNLFVNADGEWLNDRYIPAYVRRYPFAFLLHEDKLILCVDEDSESFVKTAKKKDLKFFEDNEQTKTTKFVMDFCIQFHKDQLLTQEFSRALKEADLLKPQQLTATFNDKKATRTLAGFKIIDEKKLQELDGEKLQEFNKNGYLAFIYFHLLSLSNFNKLTKLVK